MICVAIQESNVDRCIEMTKNLELAEIRIDLCRFNNEEVREVFSKSPAKLIATCRPVDMTTERQKELLMIAIEAGAAMVDIEIEAEDNYKRELIAFARLHQCKVIVSYHNYMKTPETSILKRIIDECLLAGADLAKIATLATSPVDAARLISLYETDQPILVLGMGEYGKITRVASTLLGSPFTFAAMDEKSATAPGQLTRESLQKVYDFMK